MNLEDFVSASLCGIVQGIIKAQETVKGTGALISPHMRSTSEKHSIGTAEGYGGQPVSNVTFDVVVTANDSTGTKGGVGVVVGAFALGSQGKSDASHGTESRIQFSVPIMLPTPTP